MKFLRFILGQDSMVAAKHLEDHLKRKLYLPREIVSYDLSEMRIHLLTCLIELSIRIDFIELRMVESIERFNAELHVAFFGNGEILEQTGVEVLDSRATYNTRCGIARIRCSRRLDRAGV